VPLITASLNNNMNGFKELFESHYPSVCRRLTALLGSRSAAEDVAQEAFIKLYEAPPREFTNPGGWLTRVATNMAYNHLNSEKSRRRREADIGDTLTVVEPDPAEELLRDEKVAFTRRVLALLPERDRACLLLKFSGMDYAAIARVIGVKESSVGTLLARARARFKSEYLKLGGSDHDVL
jgi:RNA polymerase sigma factor (sigma-70 family)